MPYSLVVMCDVLAYLGSYTWISQMPLHPLAQVNARQLQPPKNNDKANSPWLACLFAAVHANV